LRLDEPPFIVRMRDRSLLAIPVVLAFAVSVFIFVLSAMHIRNSSWLFGS
jgi:hypothetical protein